MTKWERISHEEAEKEIASFVGREVYEWITRGIGSSRSSVQTGSNSPATPPAVSAPKVNPKSEPLEPLEDLIKRMQKKPVNAPAMSSTDKLYEKWRKENEQRFLSPHMYINWSQVTQEERRGLTQIPHVPYFPAHHGYFGRRR